MKVVVHPADRAGGCGMYRLTFPSRVLIDAGHDVELAYDAEYRCVWQPSAWGDRIVGIEGRVDADVVVLQRPMHRNRVELIDQLQAQGVAVVVEVDDDFHAIHRKNPAWLATNPLEDADRNRDWLKKACARADLVTVSTPTLASRYGSHGRVAVLPNCVPEAYTTLEPGAYTDTYLERPEGLLVGWTGSIVTHPDDLEATGGGAAEAIRATGAKFHVVGTGKGVKDALELDDEPTSTGWLPIEAYPEAMLAFDVGIVPLAAHNFNEAKSWLKGLEMASLGVPFVASPTGEYRKLSDAGIGWIAQSPAEWRFLVEQLIRDRPHREALALAWRAQVAADHTYERNAWKWWAAWEMAAENRRQSLMERWVA